MRVQWGQGYIKVISGKLGAQGMNLERITCIKGMGNRTFDRLEKGGMEHIGKWVTVI